MFYLANICCRPTPTVNTPQLHSKAEKSALIVDVALTILIASYCLTNFSGHFVFNIIETKTAHWMLGGSLLVMAVNVTKLVFQQHFHINRLTKGKSTIQKQTQTRIECLKGKLTEKSITIQTNALQAKRERSHSLLTPTKSAPLEYTIRIENQLKEALAQLSHERQFRCELAAGQAELMKASDPTELQKEFDELIANIPRKTSRKPIKRRHKRRTAVGSPASLQTKHRRHKGRTAVGSPASLQTKHRRRIERLERKLKEALAG